MPGYWRQPELTAAAFDDEGFYKFGDAISPPIPTISTKVRFRRPHLGRFQTEQRHLGQRRPAARALCRRLRAAGARRGDRRINRDHLAALVLLDPDGCRAINPGLPAGDIAAAAADPTIRAEFRKRFADFLATATGSSTRITRAVLIDSPLSIDRGEVTDKGSVNQRAVLEHRAGVVDDLYRDAPPPQVIALQP